MAAEQPFQKAFYEIVKQCIDGGLIDGEAMAADGSYIPANVSRESWINVETEVEQSMQSYLDSLDEELSNQPGFKKPPTKIVRKCRTTSQTDPDSGYINHGSKRGIHDAASQNLGRGQFLRLETGTLYFKDSKKGHSRGYGRMPPCCHGPKS